MIRAGPRRLRGGARGCRRSSQRARQRARSPTRCCCSSTRPSTPRAAARRPTSCRWARTGTGCRGSRSSTPIAAAGSPTTGPDSWSPTRSSTSAGSTSRRRAMTSSRQMEAAMIAALGDHGVEARLFEGLTGVWVGSRAAARRRRAQDRLDRDPHPQGDQHARPRDQRQQRPAAVRVGRPVRDRGLPDDLARRASSAPSRTSTRSRPRSPSASARSTAASSVETLTKFESGMSAHQHRPPPRLRIRGCR